MGQKARETNTLSQNVYRHAAHHVAPAPNIGTANRSGTQTSPSHEGHNQRTSERKGGVGNSDGTQTSPTHEAQQRNADQPNSRGAHPTVAHQRPLLRHHANFTGIK